MRSRMNDDEYQKWLEEDTERFNRLGEIAKELGAAIPLNLGPPPALNQSRSLRNSDQRGDEALPTDRSTALLGQTVSGSASLSPRKSAGQLNVRGPEQSD